MTDVFTFGEAMLRLSVRPGETLETAPAFDVHVAGTEANVAASLARLGRSVMWASRLPDGPLGRRAIGELRRAGVDTSAVVLVPGGRMGTYFVELLAEPLATRVIYDRAGSAAAGCTTEDVPWTALDRARIVHLSGITPALSGSCRDIVLEMARRARTGGALLSVDVNYRAKLWTPEAASGFLPQILEGADVLVCTSEDARDLFELNGDTEEVAREMAKRFDAKRGVITAGTEGAYWWQGDSTGRAHPSPVSVVDRVGAGDAFAAGVLDGLLDDDFELGVRRGIALAAMALTTRGDQAIVSRSELEAFLAGEGRRLDR